jgi:DNA-binding GntR family transcriptional regulator
VYLAVRWKSALYCLPCQAAVGRSKALFVMDVAEKTSAYAELKMLLVSYRFAPGEQLRVADLAKRLNTSTTPIREALSRLHAEGFLHLHPHRGYFAKALSLREMNDLYDFGYSLLKYAVEKSIFAPSGALCQSLDVLNKQLASLPNHTEHDVEICATGTERVLEKLMSLTQNSVMLAFFHNFQERTHHMRVLQLQQPQQMPKHLRDLQQLMETIRTRDLASALAVLDRHWKWNIDSLPDLVKEAISRHYT